jgi:alpha-galactosidase/6-phospho-beta-glucosidase family protein
MKLGISSLYTEVGINFSISHKVDNYIVSLINDRIMKPHKLDITKQDYFLELVISTKKDQKEVKVMGPDINHSDKFITYALWLPYKLINSSKNYLESYLKFLLTAAKTVFKEYGIKEEEMNQVFEDVRKEVLNNELYEFDEEYIPPPDLSDLDLD